MKKQFCALIAALLMAAVCHAHAAGIYPIMTDYVTALVDENGSNILPENSFQDAFFIEGGELFALGSPNRYFLMDGNMRLIPAAPVDMADAYGDIIIFRKDGLYGAMNREGDEVVSPEWTQLVYNGEGGFLAMTGSAYDESADEIFYIDPSGEINASGSYTVGGLSRISDDRMPIVASDGRYGYVDGQGRMAQPVEWLYAGEFEDGIAIIAGQEGKGLVDAAGNIRIRPEYCYLEKSEGFIIALNEQGKLTAYDQAGLEILFELDVAGADIAAVGGCVAVFGGETTSLYDKEGACIFSSGSEVRFSAGLNGQIIASDGQWGEACQWIINTDGSMASARYQQIIPLKGDRYAYLSMFGATYYSDDLESMQKSWNYESVRYGLMDSAGKEILPGEYLEIRALGAERFLLISDLGVFFADQDGNIIREWIMTESKESSF